MLLLKLSLNGISGKLLKLLGDILCCRKQQVGRVLMQEFLTALF